MTPSEPELSAVEGEPAPAGPPSAADAATVRGLTARAGGAVLVDGAGFRLRHGRVTALVGPSGSGKTTTALALLGEAEPGVRLTGAVEVAGTTVVDGDGVTAAAHGVRGGTVGYLPQHPGSALNPARRTGSVLTELVRLHRSAAGHTAGSTDGHTVGHTDRSADGKRMRRKEAAPLAAEALERAQLGADAAPFGRLAPLRRFPHQFSGGQRQRVALAQLLACDPEVLVLDEPGTGLDTVTRMGMARELAALAASGPAILLLSHDDALVRALSDHTVRLERGRVVADGPTADVLPGRTAAASVPAPTGAPRVPPAEADRPALDVRSLTAWLRPRGRERALHDVSFALPPGGATAVAGRSGSGKTTLARCLAGLHERHRGEILLDGDPLPVLRHRGREQKRRVQYVWQEVRGSFDERRGVLGQVARTAVRLRARPTAEATDEAAALLDGLGVAEDTARRRPAALSGGELQRAALARALLADPDVLVCDEITTALDEPATARVLAELARRRRESGTAVLWIGHDLRLIREFADDLLVLAEDGTVAEQGGCQDVLAAPRSETTGLLLAAEDLSARG